MALRVSSTAPDGKRREKSKPGVAPCNVKEYITDEKPNTLFSNTERERRTIGRSVERGDRKVTTKDRLTLGTGSRIDTSVTIYSKLISVKTRSISD